MVRDKNSLIFLRALFCSPIKYAEKMRLVLRVFSTHFFPSVLLSYFKSTSKSKILGFSLTGRFGAGWFCGLDYYVDSLKLSKALISWRLLWSRTKKIPFQNVLLSNILTHSVVLEKLERKQKVIQKCFAATNSIAPSLRFFQNAFLKKILVLSLCFPGLVFLKFGKNWKPWK